MLQVPIGKASHAVLQIRGWYESAPLVEVLRIGPGEVHVSGLAVHKHPLSLDTETLFEGIDHLNDAKRLASPDVEDAMWRAGFVDAIA